MIFAVGMICSLVPWLIWNRAHKKWDERKISQVIWLSVRARCISVIVCGVSMMVSWIAIGGLLSAGRTEPFLYQDFVADYLALILGAAAYNILIRVTVKAANEELVQPPAFTPDELVDFERWDKD